MNIILVYRRNYDIFFSTIRTKLYLLSLDFISPRVYRLRRLLSTTSLSNPLSTGNYIYQNTTFVNIYNYLNMLSQSLHLRITIRNNRLWRGIWMKSFIEDQLLSIKWPIHTHACMYIYMSLLIKIWPLKTQNLTSQKLFSQKLNILYILYIKYNI